MLFPRFRILCVAVCLAVLPSTKLLAQGSFRVQCPTSTNLHGTGHPNAAGAIKCQEISGGDGFATMGDGHQIYLFGFGPLSGLKDIANGLPGTQTAAEFNKTYDAAVSNQTRSQNAGIKDPAAMMNIGVMNANFPAPLMAIDEDDEFFLTLTNVGMIMRPGSFRAAHGALPRISQRFLFLRWRAGCIGGHQHRRQLDVLLYRARCRHVLLALPHHAARAPADGHGGPAVRPAAAESRERRDFAGTAGSRKRPRRKWAALLAIFSARNPATCRQQPARAIGQKYAYNDGDGSTRYDVEYPVQMIGFDPNFHFVGMTFNPEGFADMKDKYFLLSGRSYPDTVNTPATRFDRLPVGAPIGVNAIFGRLQRRTSDHPRRGQTRALLRISDLSVTEFRRWARSEFRCR